MSRHHDVLQGFRNSTALSNAYGVSLDPVSRSPTPQGDVVSGHGRPGHLRLRTLVSKGLPPAGFVSSSAGSATGPNPSRRGLAVGKFRLHRRIRGKLPMDVISELMGVPEPDRRGSCAGDGVLHREDAWPTCPDRRAGVDRFDGLLTELIGEFKKTLLTT
ncbi:putative cytochrome P450 [Mycobacterium xenopi 4042]|uniref:Putative cytochrome P450 n=1 Tax=Mycobacterium xenopi 4042 TaxID=1299334 RepID=X8CWM6_MYCXE|nr:putative cytochrome P450 [Mycobacterium xenopi 4042]